jgi:hypothetical protein
VRLGLRLRLLRKAIVDVASADRSRQGPLERVDYVQIWHTEAWESQVLKGAQWNRDGFRAAAAGS